MGKINVDLQFTANTQQAKAQLDQLKNSLNQLGNLTNINLKTDKITKEIVQASNAALQLKASLEAATNVNTGKLSLTKFNQELKTSGLTLNDYAAKLSALGPQGTQAFTQLTESIIKADSAISTGSKLLANFAQTMANVTKYQLSTAVYRGFTQAISSAYNYAQDLNKSLNKIRIVTGQTVDQMDRFADKANKAAKALSTTTTAYTDAALIFYQQGLNDKEVEERTNTVIKMMNVTGQAAEETSSQMTAIWNNFDNGAKTLEYYADVITALGAATASSSKEIATGLEKFAAIAETVGLSYEYATTALATVTAETRQSAEVVGTAFKTLFARIQDLDLGKTLDDGTTLGKYSKALQTIGVNIKDTSGEVRDMNSILDDMGAKWGGLSDATKIAVAQTVAGQRQYAQLMALMNNWGKFQKNLEIANDAEGALNKQQEIFAQSWEGAKKRVTAAAQDIYKSLLDDKFFIGFTNGMGKVLNAISDIIKGMDGLKGIIPLVTSLLLQFAGPQILNGLTTMRTTLVGMLPAWLSFKSSDGKSSGFLQPFKNLKAAAQEGYKTGGIGGALGAVINSPNRQASEGESLRKQAFEAQRMMQDASTITGQAKISLLNRQESLLQDIANLNDKITTSEKAHLNALMDRNRELEKTAATTGEIAATSKTEANAAWINEQENSDDAQAAVNVDKEKYVNSLKNLQDMSHQERIVSQWSNVKTGNLQSLGLDSQSPFMKAAEETLTKAQQQQLETIRQKVANQPATTELSSQTQQELADIGKIVQDYLRRQIKHQMKNVETAGENIGLSQDETDEAIIYAKSDLSKTFNKAGYMSALAEGQKAQGFKLEELSALERGFVSKNEDLINNNSFDQLKDQYLISQEQSIGLDSIGQIMPNTENLQANEESLDILKEKLRELQAALQEVGTEAAPELSQALENLDVDSLNAEQAVEKLKNANEALKNDTTKNTNAINNYTTALTIKAKQEGRDVKGVENAIKATETATENAKTHARALYTAKQGYEDAGRAVDQYKMKTQSLGAISLIALRGITSLASSINMLKSVISIFNDNEKTFGEKLLTALPMMLPMVTMAISSFTAFSGAIGGLTTKIFAHTLAQKLDNVVKQEGLTLDNADNIQKAIQLMRIPLLISGKQSETIAETVLTKAKEKGTVATWGMVAAEIAAQVAAGPIVWIIMAIVGALTILITVLSAVAAAEKARKEQEIESNKRLIEQNKLISESIDKNQELANSIDNLVESYQDLNQSGENTYDTLKQMDEEIPKLIKSYKDLSEQMDAAWLNNDALDLEASYQQAKATGNWADFQAKKDSIDQKLVNTKANKAKESFENGTNAIVSTLLLKSGSAFTENGKVSDLLAGNLFNRNAEMTMAEELLNNTSLGNFVTLWGAVSDYSKNLGTKLYGWNDAYGLKTQFNGSNSTEVLRYYKALKEASAYGSKKIATGDFGNVSGVLQDIDETIKIIEDSGVNLEELRQAMIDLETEDFNKNQAKNITLTDYLFNKDKLIKNFTDKGYTEEEALSILNSAEGLSVIRSASNEDNLSKMISQSGLSKKQLAKYFDTNLTTPGEKAAFIALSTNDDLLKNINGNINNLNTAIQKQLQETGKLTTSQEVEQAGLDKDVWEVYTDELNKTNEFLNDHIALTSQIAKDNLRFNQGLITAAKSWKTYSAALRDGNTATAEYAEGLAAIQKGFKEAFGVDVSAGWVSSNLDFIDKIMTGNLESSDQITWSNMLNTNAEEFINNTYSGTKKQRLQTLRQDLAGASPEALLAYSQSGAIQQAIENDWFTAEDVQKTLQARGLSYNTTTGEIGIGVADLNYLNMEAIQKAAGTDKNSKKKHKLYEDEVDSYHEIKRAISNTKDELEEYNKIADESVGQTKLAAIDKQIEKNKILSQQYSIQTREAQKQQDLYSNKLTDLGYDIQTVNGEIINYTELYAQALKEYNDGIDAFNKGQIDTDALQEITDKYEDFKNYMSEYEEATDTFKDAVEAQKDIEREILSKNYEKLTYELEIKTTNNENDKKIIEYFLGKVEDDIYKVAEAGVYLEKQQKNITEALAIQKDAYDKVSQAYKDGQISQADYIDSLQDEYDAILDNLEALNDYDEKMKTYYSDTLQNGIDLIDTYIGYMDKQVELLNHYQSLLKISGGEFDFNKQLILQNALANEAQRKTNELNEEVKVLEAQRDRVAKELAAADSEESRKRWQDEYNRIQDMLTEIKNQELEAAEEEIEALNEIFKTTMEETFRDIELAATEGMGFNELEKSLANIKSLADIWLDDTNKTYETNKMLRDINKAIENTDNKAAKDRYNAFANDIKALQNKKDLTKGELELAQSRYKVLQAQIALEEAQNAKSIVRLRRDNEGNFGYIYTADENKIADAEQKAADAENESYNKRVQMSRDNSEKILKINQDHLDRVKDLWNKYREGEIPDEETFQRLLAEEDETFALAKEGYQRNLILALGNPDDPASIYGTRAENEKRTLDIVQQCNEKEDKAIKEHQNNIQDSFDKTNARVQELTDKFIGQDGENLEQATKDVDAANEELAKQLGDENSGVIGAVKNAASAAAGLTTAWNNQLSAVMGLREYYEKELIPTIQDAIEKQQKLNKLNTEEESPPPTTPDNTPQFYTYNSATGEYQAQGTMGKYISSTTTYDSSEIPDFNLPSGKTGTNLGAEVKAAKEAAKEVDTEAKGYKELHNLGVQVEYANKNGTWKNTLISSNTPITLVTKGFSLDTFASIGQDEIFYKCKIDGQEYYVKGTDTLIGTNGQRQISYIDGSVPLFQKIDYAKYGLTPLDTGGYTGQWGPSGKLAVLHQKEIVLNADDTRNFLQAVDILRSIVSVIDLGTMQAMADTMVSSSINSANNSLNQNVTIHAEFPNAVNHTEIEQAFDNLVNKASQYANRQ